MQLKIVTFYFISALWLWRAHLKLLYHTSELIHNYNHNDTTKTNYSLIRNSIHDFISRKNNVIAHNSNATYCLLRDRYNVIGGLVYYLAFLFFPYTQVTDEMSRQVCLSLYMTMCCCCMQCRTSYSCSCI